MRDTADGRMYGVAIRNRGSLFLLCRIGVHPKGDVYLILPRDLPGNANYHASYHESGTGHIKGGTGRPLLQAIRQKPDACFKERSLSWR